MQQKLNHKEETGMRFIRIPNLVIVFWREEQSEEKSLLLSIILHCTNFLQFFLNILFVLSKYFTKKLTQPLHYPKFL